MWIIILSGIWIGIGIGVKSQLGFLAPQDPELPPPDNGLLVDSVGDQLVDSNGDRLKGLVF